MKASPSGAGVLGDAGGALPVGNVGDRRVHFDRSAEEDLCGVRARAVDDPDGYLTDVDLREVDQAIPDVEVEPVLGPWSLHGGWRRRNRRTG